MAARQRRGKSQEAQDILPPSRSRASRRRKRETIKVAPAPRKSSGLAPAEKKARTQCVRDAAPTWIDALAREHGGGARRYLVVELQGRRRVLISFATRELAEIYAEDEARWGTRCTVVDLDVDAAVGERRAPAKERAG